MGWSAVVRPNRGEGRVGAVEPREAIGDSQWTISKDTPRDRVVFEDHNAMPSCDRTSRSDSARLAWSRRPLGAQFEILGHRRSFFSP
jgi:hypothetical protein